jgi:hypothetical protein
MTGIAASLSGTFSRKIEFADFAVLPPLGSTF